MNRKLVTTTALTLAAIAVAQRIPQTRGVLVPQEGVVARFLGFLGLD